jgi:hypothetical protein
MPSAQQATYHQRYGCSCSATTIKLLALAPTTDVPPDEFVVIRSPPGAVAAGMIHDRIQ